MNIEGSSESVEWYEVINNEVSNWAGLIAVFGRKEKERRKMERKARGNGEWKKERKEKLKKNQNKYS